MFNIWYYTSIFTGGIVNTSKIFKPLKCIARKTNGDISSYNLSI